MRPGPATHWLRVQGVWAWGPCNGITRSDYFPGLALQLLFIYNVIASHCNMHDYAKSITEPLLNLILLFSEKTRCFYHEIAS